VPSLTIVEHLNIFKDTMLSLVTGLVPFKIDMLCFEGVKKAFHCCVMCALLRGVGSVGANPTRHLLLQPEVLWSSSRGNKWVKASEEKVM